MVISSDLPLSARRSFAPAGRLDCAAERTASGMVSVDVAAMSFRVLRFSKLLMFWKKQPALI